MGRFNPQRNWIQQHVQTEHISLDPSGILPHVDGHDMLGSPVGKVRVGMGHLDKCRSVHGT